MDTFGGVSFALAYWSRLPFPTPGDLSYPGIKPTSLMSPALIGRFFTTSATGKSQTLSYLTVNRLSTDNSSLLLCPMDSIHLSLTNTDLWLLSWIGPAHSARFPLPKDRKCLPSDFTMSCVLVSENKYFLNPALFSSCLQMESFLVPSLFHS